MDQAQQLQAQRQQQFSQNLIALQNYGFDQLSATQALNATNNDLNRALDYLTNQAQPQQNMQGSAQGAGTGGGMPALQGPQQPQQHMGAVGQGVGVGVGVGGQGMSQDDLALQQVLALSQQTAEQDQMRRAQAPASSQGIGGVTGVDADEQLQAAIAASMQTRSPYDTSVEPLPPDQRMREENQPAGLRNIGNTCYFNSLLQVYYSIPEFVIQILDFKGDDPPAAGQDVQMNNQEQSGNVDALNEKLVKSGKQLILELKKLFAAMSMSNKKYLDPSGVLKSIVDDQGTPYAIGEEKDIREFNDVLLSRIRNAFDSRRKEEEEKKQQPNAQVPPQQPDDVPVQPEEELPQSKGLTTQSSFMDAPPEGSAKLNDVQMQSSEEQKEDAIDSTFIGKVKQLVEFTDKQSHHVQRESAASFSDVMLQISDEKDFYKAWENAFQDTIQGYEVDETTKCDATKTEWIVKLPEVLTFQMNRLKFENGRVVKQNHELPIQREIHPDRFMLENREEVEKLRKRVKVLRDKIKFLEECHQRYTNYNGSGVNITNALEQVFHLFSNQNVETPPKTELENSEMSDVKTFLPQNQNAPAADIQLFAQLMPKIEEMKKNTALQVEQLEKQIAVQQTNLNQMYKHLSHMKYQLHGVCIHDGSAESGHYYTLIKDHYQGVWREFNDIRVKTVDEETVLSQSKGGEGYKSAYWLVYISDKMLNAYKAINYNQYDPQDMQKNVQNHIYGQRIQPNLLDAQRELNKQLVTEVDEFKNSEAANKVTSLYDKRLVELQNIFEPKGQDQKVPANKELANFYASLYMKDLKDTAKRLLLDQCFFETQNVRRQDAERASGVLMKIDEKSQGRPTYPQKDGNWLSEQEQVIVQEQMADYKETFLNQFIQCQVFEKFIEEDYCQSIAFAEWNIKRRPEIFETNSIQQKENKQFKILYDLIRIMTLRICTAINEDLIRLHQNPNQPEVKSNLVQNAITLLSGTKLFWKNDKHAAANAYNLQYSMQKFQDVLTQQCLTNDFQKLLVFINALVENGSAEQFDNSKLENEQDFSTCMSEKNMEEINAIQSRDWMTWTAIEGSLMTRLNNANTEFRKQFGPWVQWHIKVIQEKNNVQYNEQFELNAGVNVAQRTLPAPPETKTSVA